MGAVPKHKISSMRQGKRRAAIKLAKPHFYACPKCGQPKRPHRLCPACSSA